MNPNSEFPRFCEQCGAPLPEQARFCEGCGLALQPPSPSAPAPPSPPIATAAPPPPTHPSPPSPPKSGPIPSVSAVPLSTLVASAAALLLLAVLLISWLKRSPDSALASSQSSETTQVADTQPIPPTELSHQPQAAAQTSSTPSAPPQDLTEDQLGDWLIQQDWYTTLRESMPNGVRAGFQFFEQDPPDGYHWLEIREFRSPDSGYDPDISPMIGMFRVSKDLRTTEHMDGVTAEWVSTRQFLENRGITEGNPQTDAAAPAADTPAEFIPPAASAEDSQVQTPPRGSPLRAQITEAARQFVIRDLGVEAPKEPFLFVIDELRVKDRHAFFQGYPVKQDGSPLPGFVGDTVFTFILEKEREGWLVFTDLTRSDVPTDEEVRDLRLNFMPDFPKEILSEFWKNLLFP